MSLQFRPGGFRIGELVCADCRFAVDRLTIVDWHGENERLVCDDCHPGLAQSGTRHDEEGRARRQSLRVQRGR